MRRAAQRGQQLDVSAKQLAMRQSALDVVRPDLSLAMWYAVPISTPSHTLHGKRARPFHICAGTRRVHGTPIMYQLRLTLPEDITCGVRTGERFGTAELRCVGAQIRSAHIRAEVMSNCVSLQKAHEPPATNGRVRPTVVDRPRGATTADRPVSE